MFVVMRSSLTNFTREDSPASSLPFLISMLSVYDRYEIVSDPECGTDLYLATMLSLARDALTPRDDRAVYYCLRALMEPRAVNQRLAEVLAPVIIPEVSCTSARYWDIVQTWAGRLTIQEKTWRAILERETRNWTAGRIDTIARLLASQASHMEASEDAGRLADSQWIIAQLEGLISDPRAMRVRNLSWPVGHELENRPLCEEIAMMSLRTLAPAVSVNIAQFALWSDNPALRAQGSLYLSGVHLSAEQVEPRSPGRRAPSP